MITDLFFYIIRTFSRSSIVEVKQNFNYLKGGKLFFLIYMQLFLQFFFAPVFPSFRQERADFLLEAWVNSGNLLSNRASFAALKFIYSQKAAKFCEISTIDLTGTTVNIYTVKSRAVDRSTIQRSKVQGQRSQYIRIKFPLHKESENPWACY